MMILVMFLSFTVGLVIGLIVMEQLQKVVPEPYYSNVDEPPRFCDAPARRVRK
jgi:hypothetical protein